MTTEKTKIFGILLRYSDKLFSEKIDTIKEHNTIIKKHGECYIGKAGRAISVDKINLLMASTANKWIIVVKRVSGLYQFYKAPLIIVVKRRPDSKLIPEYYRDSKHISAWFNVGGEFLLMGKEEVVTWVVKSSKFPVIKVLPRSMAGYFIVQKMDFPYSQPVITSRQIKEPLV